jgi:hypothetical protein
MTRRRTELALVFGMVPVAVWWGCPSRFFLPVLWLAAWAGAAAARNDPAFQPGCFRLTFPLPAGWFPRLAGRAAVVAAGLAAIVLIGYPDRWLEMPRTRPGFWLAVLALYPILSVYPQEVLYRVFFFKRYGAEIRSGWMLIGLNALAFGWTHLVFGNALAIVLSTLGGVLLADTYRRTGSLALVCLEHTLYGHFVLTVGLGEYFYHGRAG